MIKVLIKQNFDDKIEAKLKEFNSLAELFTQYSIKDIIEPSEQVQLYAIELFSLNIGYIEHPTQKVQETVISKGNECIFKYIQNPSERTKRIAVYRYPKNIIYIQNPSKKLQQMIVNISGFNIRYLKDPEIDIQLLAIRNNIFSVKYIDNLNNKIKQEVINYIIYYRSNLSAPINFNRKELIGYLGPLSYNMILDLINYEPSYLFYIKHISFIDKLKLLKLDFSLLQYLPIYQNKIIKFLFNFKK